MQIGRVELREMALDALLELLRTIVHKVLETIERLDLFPDLGHEGRDSGTYERTVSGTPYIIVYEIRWKPSAILVIAIVQGTRSR